MLSFRKIEIAEIAFGRVLVHLLIKKVLNLWVPTNSARYDCTAKQSETLLVITLFHRLH